MAGEYSSDIIKERRSVLESVSNAEAVCGHCQRDVHHITLRDVQEETKVDDW